MQRIGIVNYGMGNLFSVYKALIRLGVSAELVSAPEMLRKYDRLVLPGVGHFGYAMSRLTDSNLKESLADYCSTGKHVLGICLGMQLLTSHSEEGDCSGLGLIRAKTMKFSFIDSSGFRLPHIGWNTINVTNAKANTDLIWVENSEFYFVHSYYVKCDKDENSLFKSIYEATFDSGIISDNVMGYQFHPEKSHVDGSKLLSYFLERH